ncbi:Uncharacterised protein [Candidatus Venteria ishoeyi]|uniref:Uncharacterized protein n=2 Tax=Candidatus Venteria ishoeyi TaxID=1899563 RepID=A0A1H6FI53_9GAMM|nr:Uncharacterised protein [Candidatus Venteria ishoeyi]SEH09313.1 Uncharacterised protein [Candidatus Venteria ishoeyi]
MAEARQYRESQAIREQMQQQNIKKKSFKELPDEI